MDEVKRYEQFPVSTLLLSNLFSFLVYGLGIWVLTKVGWVWTSIFVICLLALEFRLIRFHCTGCYYWGKRCAFGRGNLSGLLFTRGDSATFCHRSFSWKDMLPDLLVTLIPFLTGIVLLILEFDLLLFLALIGLLLLTTAGNSYIRGKLSCRFCKQRDLGCPAYQLFNQ